MDFLLWATRSLHIFGVVVWLGGLMYQGTVLTAVARAEGSELGRQTIHSVRRFVPFVWMCVWTVLITGVALMLFNTRFVFLEFSDTWSVLLGMKQMVFVAMMFFSYGHARMVSRVDEMATSAVTRNSRDEVVPYYQRMQQFGRFNIAFGITALLLAAGMR